MGFHDKLQDEIVDGAFQEYASKLFLTYAAALALARRHIASMNALALAEMSRKLKAEGMRIFAANRVAMKDATSKSFLTALLDEDKAIRKTLEAGKGKMPFNAASTSQIASQAANLVSKEIETAALGMSEAENKLWEEVVHDALERAQRGESINQIMEDAVARMAKAGVETIDYATGARTSVDAAIRRHLVTQANQARNRLLLERMAEWGEDLVFTSAHFGARPTHAVWQGKVYSVSGTSSKYPSLVEATGYGTVTGLCGINCRHTMTPYVEGLSKLPDTDFDSQRELTGMSSDEYYEQTQKQRAMERRVRELKRERAAREAAGLDTEAVDRKIREAQKRLREHVQQNKLVRDYDREKAWGVGFKKKNVKRLSSGFKDNNDSSNMRLFLVDKSDGTTAKLFSLENSARAKWDKEGNRKPETPAERAGILLKTGEIVFLEGTVDAIPLDDALRGNVSVTAISHTHTTAVGGTFSLEDVELLELLDLDNIVAVETHKSTLGRVFILEKNEKWGTDSAKRIVNAFRDYQETADFLARANVYDKYSGNINLTLPQNRALVYKEFKEELNAWFMENSERFGYNYLVKDAMNVRWEHGYPIPIYN